MVVCIKYVIKDQQKECINIFLCSMFSAQGMAAASVSEASGQDIVIATSGISTDDPVSTKILSELNWLAIHGIIWLLHVNLF